MICLELKSHSRSFFFSQFPRPGRTSFIKVRVLERRETSEFGRGEGLGQMLERRENFKEVNLRFLEKRREV